MMGLMKRLCIQLQLTLFAIAFSITSFAQSKHGYFYDEAGNRIERRMVLEDERLRGVRTAINESNDISYILDEGASVGSIPIQTMVTESGGKVYSLNIPVASDYNLVPALSIVYNSQSGEGDVAWGWNLSGISRIKICNKTLYFDGDAKPAATSGSDCVYELDGERLVQGMTLPTYYELETARSRILVHHSRPFDTSAGYSFDRFDVSYPDGRKAVFKQINPRQVSDSFPLVEIEDADGNRICFNYERQGNHDYIKTIEYGFDNNGNSHASISFTYENREDVVVQYRAGIAISNPLVLTSIASYDESRELMRYSFTRSSHNGTTVLTSINCINEEEYLNPVRFYYSETGDDVLLFGGFFTLPFNVSSPQNCICLSGTFLRDSYSSGMIMYENDPIQGNYFDSHSRLLITPKIGPNASYLEIEAEDGFQRLVPADIDGDGFDEAVKIRYLSADNSGTRIESKVYKFSGVSSSWTVDSISVQAVIPERLQLGHDIYSPIGCSFLFGSFLGNGKKQLMTISSNQSTLGPSHSYCSIIDLNSGELLCHQVSPFDVSYEDYGNIAAIDMDSDGKTDLVRKDGTSLHIYRFDLSSGSLSRIKTLSGLPSSKILSSALVSDINSDGYMDFAFHAQDSSQWRFYFYTGGTFVNRNQMIYTSESDDLFYFIDIDGDGAPDLVKQHGSTVSWYRNVNGAINENSEPSTYDLVGSSYAIIPSATLGVFPRTQLLILENSKISVAKYDRNESIERQISDCINSYGIRIHTDYKDISLFGNAVYQSSPDVQWDQQRGFHAGILPLSVVEQEKTTMGEDILMWNHYSYKDLCLNNCGLGFCGFREMLVEDDLSISGDVYRRRTVYNPQKRGLPILSQMWSISQDAGNKLMSNLSITYDNNSTQYGKDNPQLTDMVEYDALTGIRKRTHYIYSSYGYLLKQFSIFELNGVIDQKDTTINTYNNIISNSRYQLGLPATVYNSVKKGESSPMRKKSIMSYSVSGHLLSCQLFVVAGDSLITSETLNYTYSTKGKVLSKSVSNRGALANNTTTYTYDSLGRYCIREMDPLSRIIEYRARDKWGTVLEQTDYRGNSFSVVTDVWGNGIAFSSPNGAIRYINCSWGGNGLYTVTRQSNDAPTVVSHYDALGREILHSESRFDGTELKQSVSYDRFGRKVYESTLFKGVSTSFFSRNIFDRYGRLVETITPAGKSTTWEYNGASVTKREGGLFLRTITDASGDVVYTEDNGGEIHRILRSDGQPSSVGATTFSYDIYGRRISISDPSSGIRTWSYADMPDGSYNVVCSSSGGCRLENYDCHDRLLSVSTEGEFSTIYSYNDYGDIVLVQSSNGTSTSYSYDYLGRQSSMTQTVGDGCWMTVDYSYNPQNGLLNSSSFSSFRGVIGTESYIYSGGYLTSTLWNGSSVMTIVTEDALGLPAKVRTGVIDRFYTHNNYGYEIRRWACRDGSQSNLYDEEYTFNVTTGNISSRTDRISGNTESFSYDYLDRLTAVQTGLSIESMSYESNGNILSRSSVAGFDYEDTQHPYRMTSASATSAISALPQHISYNFDGRPLEIVEDGVRASFTYNSSGERVRMDVSDSDGNPLLTKLYFSNRYEVEITSDGNFVETLWLGGSSYDGTAMCVHETYTGGEQIIQVLRDRQGSIINTVNEYGVSVRLSYDAWGRLRNPDTWEPLTSNELKSLPSQLLTLRTYTGHELLPWFALYNCNARLYDPATTRFLGPDPFIQIPDFTQSYNRYAYCLNNPLKYTDESGELFGIDDAVIVSALIIAGVSMAIDYGIQVFANYIESKNNPDMTSQDIWLNNIDWFDIGVTGILSGLTGGYSVAAQSGLAISKFGKLLLRQEKILKVGEILITSAIDITGNGYQGVTFSQFSQRAISGIITMGVVEQLSKTLSRTNYATDIGLPEQTHHFATNKNKFFTPQMQEIAGKYGLDLDGDWNKALIRHLGRHPNEYHNFILQTMYQIDYEAAGDTSKFLELFDLYIKQTIINNPELLRKSGWRF